MADRPPEMIISVDTGGTFTDLVMWTPHESCLLKIPSTPRDPSVAILNGIAQLGVDLCSQESPSFQLIHGTTVATNCMLQRSGARTAFITNSGFGDLLYIGRQNRPKLYELQISRTPPLVAKKDTLEVEGRISPEGEVLQALNEADLSEVIASLEKEPGIESVAICTLHSYLNPSHEKRISEKIKQLFPDLHVSVSHEIMPRFREYERAVTTALNAYVQPVMKRYLNQLEERVKQPLFIFRSDGGAMTSKEAEERPVHTLLSGPAGGVLGAQHTGQSAGEKSLISFDMGGTSTDVSLIQGCPALTQEGTIGDFPLSVTGLNIHTVGAGGGSIAWIDRGNALQVGPQSAGAVPGPACYGQGEVATVTDAHMVLGHLPPGGLLGGTMMLHKERAERALSLLAKPLNRTITEIAEGIIAIANAHMVRAIKVISLERGHDPRTCTLVAFGGAGGLHGCAIAALLEMRSVLIPAAPGLNSAVGMLGAEMTREFSCSVMKRYAPGNSPGTAEIEHHAASLLLEAEMFFDRLKVSPENRRLDYFLDLRYVGQSHELSVPSEPPFEDLQEHFRAIHHRRFGYCLPELGMEWVTLRLRASEQRAERKLHLSGQDKSSSPAPQDTGFGPVYWRETLSPGEIIEGPAIIGEYSATTVLQPGWSLQVHPSSVLVLEKK